MLELKQEILFEEDKGIQNILDLPLKARYRVLLWAGIADGTNLVARFNMADIIGRTVVLKSFAVYPYGQGAVKDFWVEDSGATEQWTETIPAETRINRIFDRYNGSTYIDLLINGVTIGIFQLVDPDLPGYPLDISFDNIFYKFDAKIQTMNVRVNSEIVVDLEADTLDNPFVKVVIECYLL